MRTGAGKTTLVRILATLLRPDRGWARVAGFDVTRQPHAVRRLIGLSGQYAALDPFLTGAENLAVIGRLCGLTGRAARRRAAELTGQLDLASAAGRLVRAYSVSRYPRSLDTGTSRESSTSASPASRESHRGTFSSPLTRKPEYCARSAQSSGPYTR
jgi:ABC-type proline/glycine betaine transport system ATPase subunit